jgi:hypothetical protein
MMVWSASWAPAAACWTSELGGLNKFTHIWVYKDLNERAPVREEFRRPGGAWLSQARVRPVQAADPGALLAGAVVRRARLRRL